MQSCSNMFYGIQHLLHVDPNSLLEFGLEPSKTSGHFTFHKVPPMSHRTLLCGRESCFSSCESSQKPHCSNKINNRL